MLVYHRFPTFPPSILVVIMYLILNVDHRNQKWGKLFLNVISYDFVNDLNDTKASSINIFDLSSVDSKRYICAVASVDSNGY